MTALTITASEIPVGAEVWFTADRQSGGSDGSGVVAGRGDACVLIRTGRTEGGADVLRTVADDRLYAAWYGHVWPPLALIAVVPDTSFHELDRNPAAELPRRKLRARRRDASSTEARGKHTNRTSLTEAGGPDPRMEGQ